MCVEDVICLVTALCRCVISELMEYENGVIAIKYSNNVDTSHLPKYMYSEYMCTMTGGSH